MHIRRIVRRLAGLAALVAVIAAWATGRVDPLAGVARTYAFVKEKSAGKGHHAHEAASPATLNAAAGKLDNQTLCLAHAVYYEAGTDPHDVQVAIAQVVLNRSVTPKGTTDMRALCKVVYRGLGRPLGCLFRNTCQNIGTLPEDERRWAKSIEVAKDVAAGRAELPPLIQHASHFHAVGPRPAWSSGVFRLTRVGRMVFYSSSPVEVNAAAPAGGASGAKLGATAAMATTGAAQSAASLGALASEGSAQKTAGAAAARSATARATAKPREKAAAADPVPSPFSDIVH